MEKHMAKCKINTEFIFIFRRKWFAVRGILVMKWVLQERDMGIRNTLYCLSAWEHFVNSSRRCMTFLDQLSNYRLLKEDPVQSSSLHNDRIRYNQGRIEVCCVNTKLWHLRDPSPISNLPSIVVVFKINNNIKQSTIVNNNDNCYFYIIIIMRFRKIAKSDYYLRHVCPSVRPSIRMEELGSLWMDFHEYICIPF